MHTGTIMSGRRRGVGALIMAALLAGGWTSAAQAKNPTPEKAEAEKAQVAKVVRASIEWAQTKDKDLLYRCFAHDSTLFWFSPDNAGTVRGFDAFTKTVDEVFMNPAFKAVGAEFIDLQVHLARSGDVAWFSCILNDRNTWNGRPADWENVRWTGVLEKRGGDWVIVQMHFSYAEEEMRKAMQPQAPETK